MSQKFIPEKVLHMKRQDDKKMLLIQWKGYSLEKATWQPAQKFNNISHLISEYEKSKVNDQDRNYALKQSQKIDCGQNPYEQTSRHGHFMYGDEARSIQSIKVFKNKQEEAEMFTIICQVRWKDRVEYVSLQNGQKQINVIIENSFLDSKMVNQYRPDLLSSYYEKKIYLTHKPPQKHEELPQKQ